MASHNASASVLSNRGQPMSQGLPPAQWWGVQTPGYPTGEFGKRENGGRDEELDERAWEVWRRIGGVISLMLQRYNGLQTEDGSQPVGVESRFL